MGCALAAYIRGFPVVPENCLAVLFPDCQLLTLELGSQGLLPVPLFSVILIYRVG
jgi:hypothetical protein